MSAHEFAQEPNREHVAQALMEVIPKQSGSSTPQPQSHIPPSL
jgi:hypothetical protein